MMGVYLSMLGNQKPDVDAQHPARRKLRARAHAAVHVGLVQLNADGTPKRDALDQPIPTYDQTVIEGFAHVFTGWKWACAGRLAGELRFRQHARDRANQMRPMQAFAEQHATGAKQLLSYPGAAKHVAAGRADAGAGPRRRARQHLQPPERRTVHRAPADPEAGREQSVAGLRATRERRIRQRRHRAARQSRGVVRAILLDDEAARRRARRRDAGKLKEPLLRLTQLWRAYDGKAASGKYVNIDAATNFGQGPLTAGSVFNFFSPFYAPPGEISDQGLVAPELQIATEYQNTLIANFFYAQSVPRATRARTSRIRDAVVINIEADLALADDPAALVASGRREAARRARSRTRCGRKPSSRSRASARRTPRSGSPKRSGSSATSPEYAVQR